MAYDYAAAIYTSAAAISPPPASPSPSGSGFVSVNPHGELSNCIPPESLSPLGPVTYLSELLQVSPSSTCDTPLNPSAANALGTVIAQRRGPLANLSASSANLETPLPLIDIVNECLEFLAASSPPSAGTVYDTAREKLAHHALCRERNCSKETNGVHCHVPATIFAALPQHSTPATPTRKQPG